MDWSKWSFGRGKVHVSSGFGLLESMIALGILVIVIGIATQGVNLRMRDQKSINDLEEVEDTRRLIRLNVDCRATLLAAPATCATERETDLLNYSGAVFISRSGTTKGKFNLIPKCLDRAGMKTLVIYYGNSRLTAKQLFKGFGPC